MDESYDKLILGTWENSEIKYIFYKENLLEIHWKNHGSSIGKFNINDDIICFQYGELKNYYWEGKIIALSQHILSIEDLYNEIGKIDTLNKVGSQSNTLVKNIALKDYRIGLTKYTVCRFLLVFFSLISYEWLSNIDMQLINFFSIREGSFLFYLLMFVFVVLILAICFLFILGIFSLLHSSYNIGFKKVIQSLKLKKIKSLILSSPSIITSIYTDQKKIEKEYKTYTIPFIFYGLILILFIGGSPLINNHTAIYLSYEEFDINGNSSYKEKQSYVFQNDKEALIKNKITGLNNSSDQSYNLKNVDFYIDSRGYIFKQTALIEGFKSYTRKNSKGVINYINCLIYFFIEKLIITFLYFFAPFFITSIVLISTTDKKIAQPN